MAKYKRILLKLSGEALKGDEKDVILSNYELESCAKAIKEMVAKGLQVGVVVGAGNIWRGKLAENIGIERTTADYMGMLGTIINSLALQSACEKEGLNCRVMSSIEVKSVCEPYIRRRAIRHLEKGRVVIFGGGTGNPYFTTDTTATLRAMEIEADSIFMAKNGVEGVYDSDPRVNKNAKFIKEISYEDIIRKNLKVMDQTAIAMLMDTNIEIHVFNMSDPTNFTKLLEGQDIGSIIKK